MPQHNPKTGPTDEELADQLFRLVEADQGRAFISDGIGVLSKREILGLARASLKHTRKVARLLEWFLRNNE